MDRIAAGDFSDTDDATIGGMIALYRLTLAQAPEPLCARAIGPEAEDAFVELLAAVDSTGAEAWAAFFERIFVAAISPGRRSPAATPEEVRAAFTPIMLGLVPADRALWLRYAQAPKSLTLGERCQMAKLVFRAIDDVPGVQRIGVIRASIVAPTDP